jgi:hypothetical protein
VIPAGIAVALAVAAASMAARHAEHADSSPVTPTGGWQDVWTWCIVLALVLYAAGVLLARRSRRLHAAVAIAVVVQALPLVSPLLLSKDAYLYWSQARLITAHHANPYRTTPAAFPDDPSYAWVSGSWRANLTDYGPLWELTGTVPAVAAGESRHRAELAYRLFALLGVIATVFLVARRTRNAAAVAFVGWSPLVALHFAGGGHNDAWLALLLAVAVLFGSGVAYAGATFFKGWPVLLIPLALAQWRLRPPRRFWLGLACATAIIAAAAFAAFGTAWIEHAYRGANTSSGLGGVHFLQELGVRFRYAVALGSLVFAAIYAGAVVHAWRTGRARFSLVTSALSLTAAQLRPWYALWAVVLAAVEEDAAAAAVAFLLTSYLLLADAVPL